MMSEKKTFYYSFIVSDDLIDEYGHVNNARYLELYEKARWDILNKNIPGSQMVEINRIGPVILEVTVRFSKEILKGEEITIETSSSRKNDLVFYFEQRMLNSTGKIASKAIFTAALFDLDKRKMVRADNLWLTALGL
jgi:YbgC/YbaW family acyl-CoA thioester hydrolase